MKAKTKLIAAMLCLCFAALALSACGGSNDTSTTPESTSTAPEASSNDTSTNTPAATPEPAELTFDTPFEFDDLTITIGSGYTTTILENQFSEHDGKTVIALPITIVNNKDASHGLNMFYHKAFGPSGTELPTIYTYFTESDVSFAGEVRSGATQNSLMHILYEGDGDYFLEFSTLIGSKTEVRLPIAVA